MTEVTEPRVDQEWEERTAVRRDEQRPSHTATKRKVVTRGKTQDRGNCRRTNKEKDASAKMTRVWRAEKEKLIMQAG